MHLNSNVTVLIESPAVALFNPVLNAFLSRNVTRIWATIFGNFEKLADSKKVLKKVRQWWEMRFSAKYKNGPRRDSNPQSPG